MLRRFIETRIACGQQCQLEFRTLKYGGFNNTVYAIDQRGECWWNSETLSAIQNT